MMALCLKKSWETCKGIGSPKQVQQFLKNRESFTICLQSGMVIKFDNHVTSQHGGHFGNRRFSYAVRVFHFLFGIARLMYP